MIQENSSKRGRGFDRLAGLYDGMVRLVYGKSLKKAQLEALNYIPKGRTVLIIGGGTGWFLKELLLHCQPRKVLYVDLSEKMLIKSREAIAKLPETLKDRVFFVQGGVEKLSDLPQHEVLVTHFFLDLWQERLERVGDALEGILAAEGIWSQVDFFIPKSGWKRWRAKVLIWLMYRFFRICCKIEARKLPDFEAFFEERGYRESKSWFYSGNMIRGGIYRSRSDSVN